MLILLFGVLWPVFEISGRVSPRLELPFVTQFYLFESILRLRFDLTSDLLSHMFMPALALALPLAAIISQLLKQSLKELMALDYVVLARVKGFSETQVILREALKNAALPTLTLIGVQFTFLIGGTVIVERLFSYEGLGNMAIDAVINRDLPLIQGIVLVFALHLRADQPRRRHDLRAAQSEAAAWLRRAPSTDAATARALARRRLAARRAARRDLRAADRAARSAGAGPDVSSGCRPSGCRAPSPASGSAPTASAATCSRG